MLVVTTITRDILHFDASNSIQEGDSFKIKATPSNGVNEPPYFLVFFNGALLEPDVDYQVKMGQVEIQRPICGPNGYPMEKSRVDLIKFTQEPV